MGEPAKLERLATIWRSLCGRPSVEPPLQITAFIEK